MARSGSSSGPGSDIDMARAVSRATTVVTPAAARARPAEVSHPQISVLAT